MSRALGHLKIVADENFDAIGARVDCLKGNKNGVTAHVKKVRVGEIRGLAKQASSWQAVLCDSRTD